MRQAGLDYSKNLSWRERLLLGEKTRYFTVQQMRKEHSIYCPLQELPGYVDKLLLHSHQVISMARMLLLLKEQQQYTYPLKQRHPKGEIFTRKAHKDGSSEELEVARKHIRRNKWIITQLYARNI